MTVRGVVCGSEGSAIVNGADDVGGTRVNQPAGLSMKAVGQTRHKSATLTADHGERAVYVTLPEPVNKTSMKPGGADRCPSYRKHVSRHDRSDDLMDRGTVP